MNKVAQYLQNHIRGDVLTSDGAREYFSTDASVLTVKPNVIVYPRSTNDVRKLTRFSWQLAEKGHKYPVTARGSGTDQSGAAIGTGMIVVFPAHMSKIQELDVRQKLVRIQPGINFKSLQETLHTHGLFLPPYPASYMYSSVGGAISNNTAGEKSFKYGSMRNWVDRLEIVLANGEAIQTGRINKRELNKKKGLSTFEGEIYRELDGLITDHHELIQRYNSEIQVSKNSVGYDLASVKGPDGSFDLTPLIVGSQGTLGVVTEAILKLEPYSPKTQLVVAAFATAESAAQATSEIRQLRPSAIEMVDKHLIEFVNTSQGTQLQKLVSADLDEVPAIILLIEFDNAKDAQRSKLAKRAAKLLQKFTSAVNVTGNIDEQEKLWNIRHSAATVVNYDQGGKASLPIIEDGIVPKEDFDRYVENVYKLFENYHLESAIWGHAGDANLHMQPLLDLSKTGDRQKVFKIMDEYYRMVISMNGSIAAEHNDGRLRAPYVPLQVGEEMHQVFIKAKAIFDPHNILNPGVKTGTDIKQLVPLLRHSYSISHLADHLPRT